MSKTCHPSATDPAEKSQAARPCLDVASIVTLVGEAAAWFRFEVSDRRVILTPLAPLPSRCLVRPAALFQQDRGFPDVNTVMGRLLFQPGATEAQAYIPFTRDPQRHLRELLLRIEPTPYDDLLHSAPRWSQAQAVMKRLMLAAEIPWQGMRPSDVEDLLTLEPWHEPVEGCALHALARTYHDRGECVVEVGSLRGQSTGMLAMGLRDAGSDAMLISVDPHEDRPANRAQVALSLEQIGEAIRLVQVQRRSDAAHRILKPGAALLVFIDGNHSHEQVVRDFEHYRTLVAPGGCIAFHDYGYGKHNGKPDVEPDVRPAIDASVFPDASFRPLLLAHTLMAFVRR